MDNQLPNISSTQIKVKTLLGTTVLVLLLAAALIGLGRHALLANNEDNYRNLRTKLLESRKQEIKNEVTIAIGLISALYEETRADRGDMQLTQKRALELLRPIRFFENKSGYFMVHALDGNRAKAVLVPVKPELEGTDVTDLKDQNNKLFVRDFIKSARAGGGYVDYYFPNVAGGQPLPKITYIGHFAPWDWEIGAGVYIDDLEAQALQLRTQRIKQVNREFTAMLAMALFVVLLIMAALWRMLGSTVNRIAGQLSDTISGLQTTQAELQERTVSLRKLTAAVEQSANSVLITDTEGIIEYVNPHLCAVSGYSADEISGKRPNLFKSGYQPADFYHDLWTTIKAGREWRGEFRNKRKNGTLYWELCSIAPIRDDHGEITNFVAIKEDITTRKAQEAILTWQAAHDPLTGLYNRHYLENHLASELMKVDRKHQHLSVLVVGIDNFKFINDTFGHDAGDALLIAVGRRLQEAACSDCIVGRFLGDEFVLIPPLSEVHNSADAVTVNVRTKMAEPFQINGVELAITAGIGAVTFPDDCDESPNLLCNAESAMHEAKLLGRNSIVYYTAEFHKRAQHRLMLENRLHKALERREFSLHYQPQICMLTGAVVGIEALLRWFPSDVPPPSPAEFIPILEESGLIVPVGAWVLHEACRQVASWHASVTPELRLSVNISAVQFQQGDLHKTVRQVLAETGFDPSLLCLEVTESALLRDMEHARLRLNELRELGISLSLDDFGTGYSSLAYLSELPVQELKVDRSFVQHLHEKPSNTSVVNTIIAMAQELGLDIVAEGVETDGQKDYLISRNCTTIQGFLFSRPLPPERLIEFFLQWHAGSVYRSK